ncbi:MAG: hypothetical protein AAF826_03595 [Pseudomonadota bacterium]
MRVLIIGSGPNAVDAKSWPREAFDAIVVINNAWRIREDWSHLIHPEDFPEDRRPKTIDTEQIVVTAADYVPVQNSLGGFLYAGGTMAYTAGYWALGALRPTSLSFIGCDMVYATSGNTHFYGTGDADPLRDDITLQNLEAKSARLMYVAAKRGCACVNLSTADQSRLVFPRAAFDEAVEIPVVPAACDRALQAERDLGYMATDGRYWLEGDKYDPAELAKIDALWLDTLS